MSGSSIRTRIKVALVAMFLALPAMAVIGLPQSYERALMNVLVSEGYVYTNIKGDRGGPTNYGITIYDVRKYINPNATADDVRALTLAEAKEIYRIHYWAGVDADNLPSGLDYSVFDFGVNAGPSRALATLRACVGDARPIGDPPTAIRCVNDKRMAFQMGLRGMDKFKRGWRNRIKSVRNISLQMAGVRKVQAGGIDLYSIPRIGMGKAYEEVP